MIHANEFMIGDYVKFLGKVRKIKSIVGKDTGIEISFEGKNPVAVSLDEIEPIPLTPEILEKNGWKHEFDKTEYMVKYELAQKGKDCWMMWAIKEHNLDIQKQDEKLNMYNLKVQRVCIPCDYVHQLQHALRLCGIEKEIII